MRKVLTIAGSDSSGGAGIQADIKTITAHKMYAMSVITALTAQNTTGVFGVVETAPAFVEAQLEACFEDIMPDAVKVGMVSNEGIIKVIAKSLRKYGAKNVVVDPVMVATSGGKLIQNGAVKALQNELFPLATLVTPNIPEAEVLTGFSVVSVEDMRRAAREISQKHGGVAVLVKGGHLWQSGAKVAVDVLFFGEKFGGGGEAFGSDVCGSDVCGGEFSKKSNLVLAENGGEKFSGAVCGSGEICSGEICGRIEGDFAIFEGRFVETKNTHGTGCTLSSAIACTLAGGETLFGAVKNGKKFVANALKSGVVIGHGNGPIDHCFGI